MNLLMIHGRDQEGKDPLVLQAEWQAALNKGLTKAGITWPADIQVTFPFYGDELRRIVQELDAPLMSETAARGVTATSKELEFRAEMYTELAVACGITDAEIQAHFEGDLRQRGPLNWAWVQAILRALDQRTPFGDPALDRFTRDVYVYLTYAAATRAVDRIVTEKLTRGRWVVVAHSLGTVVAYNVLRALAATDGVEVARFVTLGSPLGVRAIRRRLASPLTMPACLADWFNAFDERDVVALYPLDAHNFAIQPPITNYHSIDNFTDNRHGIAGYLDDAEVARRIAEALAAKMA